LKFQKTPADKTTFLESVYNDIASARYAPGIPEAELVMNKGHSVARTVPVFSIRDYCWEYTAPDVSRRKNQRIKPHHGVEHRGVAVCAGNVP